MATPLSGGSDSLTRLPGQTFTLDLVLTSDDSDEINSAIARLLFSGPGLRLLSYDWSMPFENGSITDDSTPAHGTLPVDIDDMTLSGLGYPDNVVDIEFSNVILSSDRFADGTLVSMVFEVPTDYEGDDEIVITAFPDTLANGFDEIATTPGETFTLTIPSPASLALAGMAGVVAMRRRRD